MTMTTADNDHYINFVDEPPAPIGSGRLTPLKNQLHEETLGDRIGQRMLSRLEEMCVTVTMLGEDYRRTVGRTRLDRRSTARLSPN